MAGIDKVEFAGVGGHQQETIKEVDRILGYFKGIGQPVTMATVLEKLKNDHQDWRTQK